MIYHDSTFEDLANAPVKQTRVEVVSKIGDPYGWFDGSVSWNADDVNGKLMSVNIDAVGNFLGTATKKATVKLLGIVAEATAGDIFQVRLGLYDNGLDSFNTISQGFYIVDNIAFDYEAGSTTVTMYDWMWKASNTPYSAIFIYPATVKYLAQQVADALGISLMADFDTLPNASYSITEDLYINIANATLQTVIQEIAAATGTTARISDATLVFSKFTVSSENLTSTSLKKLKIGDPYGPVTSVVLGRVPQNDNVALVNDVSVSNTITGVNTTTNLITIVGNGMSDGTLVQIESTGTLPAPLQPHTNYFVFTNAQADTFALTATYADAIAGTNTIDLTTTGSGSISLSSLAIQEVQINNIEILDDERETLLPSLYSSLLGVSWYESQSETVGLAWHEVGDVINYTQGTTVAKSFLNEIHVTLDGSVKESLVSVIPDNTTIDYQTAGGVLKTIYNTEIKVDKQNNDITSIVSQQQQYQDFVEENFTKIYQDINKVEISVQDGGGVNQIKNSVGYSTDSSGLLNFWDYGGPAPIVVNLASDPEVNVNQPSSTGGWNTSSTPGASRTIDTVNYVSPPGSLKITNASSLTGGFYAKANKTISGLTIGQTYRFSVMLRAAVAKTIGVSIDTTVPTTTSDAVTPSFAITTLTFVATNTSHIVSLTSATGASHVWNIDNTMVTEGSSTYTWFSGNTLSTDTDRYAWVGSPNSTSTWQHYSYAAIRKSSDTGSKVAGALSGSRIDFSNGPGYIKQTMTVEPNSYLNLSFYAKKELQGIATITLSNDIDTYTVTLNDNTEYDWTKFDIESILPSSNYLDIKIEIDGDVDSFSITDLMLSKGALSRPWEQAAGEVANTNVTFDTTGITVKSNVYDGAFTRITPLEFAGYDDNNQLAFALNNDTTLVNKLHIGGDIETKTHSIVFVTTGPNSGMNFVVRG